MVLRAIGPSDKDALERLHAALSPRSVRRRFLSAKPRLTAADLRYFTEVDGVDHVALVACAPEQPGRLTAVGRFVRLADAPETAELAIAVADDHQRRGLGRALAGALADAARERGIRSFVAVTDGDNVAFRRLFGGLFADVAVSLDGGGVIELRGALDAVALAA